ncbi:MAG: XdhC family protein [Pseudomonadota bacterium]
MLDRLTIDPVAGLADRGGVLCVVTNVDGAAYRPVGAAMAFLHNGTQLGTVSSGCLEGALAVEAEQVFNTGQPRQVRYGKGSPWIDIQLPCGAGLDIHLWRAARGKAILSEAARSLMDREARALLIPRKCLEAARLGAPEPAGWSGDVFSLPRIPPLRLLVFGTGIETVAFAELARGAGCDVCVASDEALVSDTLSDKSMPIDDGIKEAIEADAQTAIVLFFHDHHSETPILETALKSPAFWVGAQGSRQAQKLRIAALQDEGVKNEFLGRLQDRIGLIPSTRDPRTLAVSVLADVFDAYKKQWMDPYFGACQKAVTA